MRRDLDTVAAVAVICSLLWAVCGMSVLAMSLHEHSHHAISHDHQAAIRTALHGHSHDSPPYHDHELTSPVGTSRSLAAHQFQASASQILHIERFSESPRQVGIATEPKLRDVGPPPYVMHCAQLT